jgi:hypothetical protein
MGRTTRSTAVARKGVTIVDTAVAILAARGGSLGPSEIAEHGLRGGLLRVPRGRTRGYLTQLLQSRLHDDAEHADEPRVYRPALGKYRVRRQALRAIGLA